MIGSKKKKKKKKKKLFGCPPPPAPNCWKLENNSVQKYTAPSFQNSKTIFFSFENLSFESIFKLLLSNSLHFNTGLELV